MFKKALLLAGVTVGLGVCAASAPARAVPMPAIVVVTQGAPVVQAAYWYHHHRYYHRRWRYHHWVYY